MDSRSAAHTLTRIAEYLELNGESRFKSRAYLQAGRAIQALDRDDLAPLLRSGELEALPGLGPASLAVVRELVDDGESTMLDRLRESTPEGLLEMLRVPGLGPAKIHLIHQELGVDTLRELEDAARDGRLAGLRGFGPKTSEKILKGIAFLRQSDALVLHSHAAAEAARLLTAVGDQPDVLRAEIAGDLRRSAEVIRGIVIVAGCAAAPARVAAAVARWPGIRQVVGGGGRDVQIRFVDGTLLDLRCVPVADFAIALWRATGSAAHVSAVVQHAGERGYTLAGDQLRDDAGEVVPLHDEEALYRRLGLAFVPPELREGLGEVEAAGAGTLPTLVTTRDIRGVLHAHSEFSDGDSTIERDGRSPRASAAGATSASPTTRRAPSTPAACRARPSCASTTRSTALNATFRDFRVLKGIEADILPCGRVDYDGQTLDQFDYVIGSVHSRFGMNEAQMTERVLKALDDPHLTVLGHPTGRLLLTREAYAIDMHAVIERAGEVNAAIELNADPHRLDLDWRLCRVARERGVRIEIGPDAHSVARTGQHAARRLASRARAG